MCYATWLTALCKQWHFMSFQSVSTTNNQICDTIFASVLYEEVFKGYLNGVAIWNFPFPYFSFQMYWEKGDTEQNIQCVCIKRPITARCSTLKPRFVVRTQQSKLSFVLPPTLTVTACDWVGLVHPRCDQLWQVVTAFGRYSEMGLHHGMR